MRLQIRASTNGGTFMAFVILLLILAITKTSANSNSNDNKNDNTNNNSSSKIADALSDKTQVPSWPSSAADPMPHSAVLMTSEIVISATAAPSNFNKNSLQQQEQVEDDRHFIADNNRRLRGGQNVAATATVAVAAAKGNNVNAAGTTDATDDARNGFHDKINISNQRNEFNGRSETTPAAAAPIEATSSPSSSAPVTAAAATDALKRQVAASSFLERVELQESSAMAALSPDKRQKLLLHRQKRYLLFPEGSSFQLVFDLIIPIVDYTNFAIMGITCAVAWELPSKPPSEIIENFRDKLNDGTFGLSRRRNDTRADVKYVNAGDAVGAGGGDGSEREGETAKVKMPATVAAATAAAVQFTSGNFENGVRKPTQTDRDDYNNYDNNKATYNPRTDERTQFSYSSSSAPVAYNAYYAPRRPQKYFEAGGDDFSDFSADKSKGGWKTLSSPHTKAYSKYYNNKYAGYDKNSNGGASGYADKQKYAAWHDGANSRTGGGASNEGRDKYYHRKQQQQPSWMESKYSNAAGNTGGWDKDNWWQRNKQRIKQSWRDKQREWEPHEDELAQKTPAGTPIYTAPRTGRNRKILTAPPKHHIYPVFGKRRRRRSSSSSDADAFEWKLEQIHLREQLQSRQKLYGKIEQLYKVRGHNGTACVLRALCETGQRRQHSKPQSFLTELLRVIFALPDEEVQGEEIQLDAHMTPQYRRAARAAENCEQHFAECEHSFWSEIEYKM